MGADIIVHTIHINMLTIVLVQDYFKDEKDMLSKIVNDLKHQIQW